MNFEQEISLSPPSLSSSAQKEVVVLVRASITAEVVSKKELEEGEGGDLFAL